MKFTSKDLMSAMGLAVGDKIKFYNEVFTIIENIPNYIGIENDTALYNIDILLNKDFEILPKPKRVGDLKCEEFECLECPLRCICPWDEEQYEKETLYEVLKFLQVVKSDQEIHDLLKARLDKEVKEC